MSKIPATSKSIPLRFRKRSLADHGVNPNSSRSYSNLNPFSSKGSLSATAFIVSLAGLACVNYAVGEAFQTRVLVAKQGTDFQRLFTIYAAWFAFASVGFFCVTQTFIKRWTTILDLEKLSRWSKSGLRLSLLSPLLSLLLTATTLFFSRKGPMKEPVRSRQAWSLFFALFLIFHAGFLYWRMRTQQIQLAPGYRIQLAEGETSPGDSLKRVMGDEANWPTLLETPFYVHVFPYLSPVSKYLVSLAGDYWRVSRLAFWVDKTTHEQGSYFCRLSLSFLNVPVQNCFMTHYRKLEEMTPFSNAIGALVFEAQYRKRVIQEESEKAPLDPRTYSADRQAATFLLAIQNPISMIEPHEGLRDRREFLNPMGLLKFFGSPEVSGIEFSQDLQKYLLAKKFLPAIDQQLQTLDKNLRGAAVTFTDENRGRIYSELQKLKGRIATLQTSVVP